MAGKVDLKVVLLGKEYGGKTSLVERYIHGKFNSSAPYQSVSISPEFTNFSVFKLSQPIRTVCMGGPFMYIRYLCRYSSLLCSSVAPVAVCERWLCQETSSNQ